MNEKSPDWEEFQRRLQEANQLRDQGTLSQAVAAYDAAIALGEQLDLVNLEYRNGLASAHMNKGNALPKQSNFQKALEAYEKAIALTTASEELSAARIEVAAKAYLGEAIAHFNLSNPDSAADAADEGLGLLRDLESASHFALRPLREQLFGLTLNAYLATGQFQFLPEVITEHLDPAQAGSAPASETMHAAALNAINRGMYTLFQTPRGTEQLAELEEVARLLVRWRSLYFAGTAASARLQALDHERRGDPEQAEQTLRDYIQARPLDPEGYLSLGDFQVGKPDGQAAKVSYQEAARALVRGLPDGDAPPMRIPQVVTIAERIVELEMVLRRANSEMNDASTAVNDADRQQLIQSGCRLFEGLRDLLMMDFVDGLFTGSANEQLEHWRALLIPELRELWEQQFGPQFDQWISQYARGMAERERQQAYDTQRQRFVAMTRGMLKGLGRSWEDYRETVTYALQEIWDAYPPESQQDDEQLEAEIAEAVGRTMETASRRLAGGELKALAERVRGLLGTIWDQVLDEQEQRFLCCGLRSMRLPGEDMARSAGLNLGLAVEWSLLNRIYQRLRDDWQKTRQGDAIPELGDDWPAPKVALFLTRARPLMVGDMVGGLNRALAHADEAPGGLQGLIIAQLRQLPNPAGLLASDPAARKRRSRQLDAIINRLRIRCAHPEPPPTEDELRDMWEAVVEDADDAFFRYFGAAYLAPEAEVAVTIH